VDWHLNVADVYDLVDAPKYMLKLRWTDHMTVSDMAATLPGAELFLMGYWWCWETKKALYQDYSAAFFDAYLKGDSGPLDSLTRFPHFLVRLLEYED
jgi:hypothetical protein